MLKVGQKVIHKNKHFIIIGTVNVVGLVTYYELEEDIMHGVRIFVKAGELEEENP